jgi:hypothetical protein
MRNEYSYPEPDGVENRVCLTSTSFAAGRQLSLPVHSLAKATTSPIDVD